MNLAAAPDNSRFLTKRMQSEADPKVGTPLFRTPYEHDRDRIIHSRAFRRLMHKTQIFNSRTNDHIRNRLTHTMEVYQIARSLGKALELNIDLIEAIALGHDLGHTPFGHVGERTLHNILMGHSKRVALEIAPGSCGGFKHNYQSVSILDYLEVAKPNFRGLNATLAVREGVFKHTGNTMRFGEDGESKEKVCYPDLDFSLIDISKPSFTLEGQVVAIADEIAQCTHDLEDAKRQGIMDIKDLKELAIVKQAEKKYALNLSMCRYANEVKMQLLYYMIDMLIEDVYLTSSVNINKIISAPTFEDEENCINRKMIAFSDEMKQHVDELDDIKVQKIIQSRDVSIEDSRAEYIIEQVFKAYYQHPMQLPSYILDRYCSMRGKKRSSLKKSELIKDTGFVRLICDHIGSMTDQFAEREFRRLYEPEFK